MLNYALPLIEGGDAFFFFSFPERKDMDQTEQQPPQPQRNRKFWIKDCAFLRVVYDEKQERHLTCILRKGQECVRHKVYPAGEPCEQAVKKVPDRKLKAQKKFWTSVAKHNKKKDISKDSAYKHKTSGREEYKFCKRKTRYPTEAKAKEVKRRCEEKRGVLLRVLYCPYCKGWHLTHKYAERFAQDNFG